ncbi:hypothetical protein [Streptomyces graminilatus]|uniref:hypothetical protein n=1 Tax=Streptomyces graminilatus TaxID=1464070 RepID=UPI0006E25140|nr:hypothetical protein [Streptomyces graminilatus]
MATDEEPNVRIGDVSHSTFAIGSHARAVGHHGTAPQRDRATEELLEAVRELRADLARVRPSAHTDALRAALEETEVEITRTGRAAPSRRERLRELLSDAQALLSVFASAGVVAGLVGL